MTKEEQNQKLDEAAALITEVLKVQSQEKHYCETCRAPEYVDWVAHKMREQLEGLVRKLRKLQWVDLDAEPETHAPGRRGKED